MTTLNLIQEGSFLYSVWGVSLRVYQGDIVRSATGKGTCVTKFKNLDCSLKPCVVYNGVVWLPKRNDELAIRILIENEEKTVFKLKDKIEHHKNKIELLKNERSKLSQ